MAALADTQLRYEADAKLLQRRLRPACAPRSEAIVPRIRRVPESGRGRSASSCARSATSATGMAIAAEVPRGDRREHRQRRDDAHARGRRLPAPGRGRPSATAAAETRVVEDAPPGRKVYDPGHPDADADGFVEYPNVDINTELVDLMIARRVHEANATVFQAAKGMLQRALEI